MVAGIVRTEAEVAETAEAAQVGWTEAGGLELEAYCGRAWRRGSSCRQQGTVHGHAAPTQHHYQDPKNAKVTEDLDLVASWSYDAAKCEMISYDTPAIVTKKA